MTGSDSPHPLRGNKGVHPQTYAKGLWAETIAALLLMAKGYRILDRRFRSPVGEIDLVAKRGRRVVFVEVKIRATTEDGAWSVTPRQQERIARAAEAWRRRNAALANAEMSFDVVLVAPRSRPRHIRDAFRI